jgi:hypothetical protein
MFSIYFITNAQALFKNGYATVCTRIRNNSSFRLHITLLPTPFFQTRPLLIYDLWRILFTITAHFVRAEYIVETEYLDVWPENSATAGKEIYSRITAGGNRVLYPLTTKIYTGCRKTPCPNFLMWQGGQNKDLFLRNYMSEMRLCKAPGRQIGSKVGNQAKTLKYS